MSRGSQKKIRYGSRVRLRGTLPSWRLHGKVVVEAKTVEKFADAHFAQVNSYLYFSGLEVGIRRVVNTKP